MQRVLSFYVINKNIFPDYKGLVNTVKIIMSTWYLGQIQGQ